MSRAALTRPLVRLFAAAALTFLSACMVTTERYYIPTDPALLVEGSVCGFVPWARTDLSLPEGTRAAVDVYPKDGKITVGIQVSLPKGTALRFVDQDIRLLDRVGGRTYGAPIGPWSISVYGRNGAPGHREDFAAGAVLEGRGRNADLPSQDAEYLRNDVFGSGAIIAAPSNQQLVLVLPAIEVNGFAVASREVPLTLVEKSGLATCIS